MSIQSWLVKLIAPVLAVTAAAMLNVGSVRAGDAMPLVSTAWLAAHRADPDLVILDVRSALDGGGAEAFVRAHIPGAVHSDYDKAGWRVTRNGVPFMVPTVAELEKLIGELGIDEDNRVVVAPAGVHVTDFGAAARVYWTLKLVGLKQVSILDGGFAAWTAAALPVEAGQQPPSPKIFTATIDRRLVATPAEVEHAQQAASATLIDARSPALFSGREKPPAALAYGHIPGAINLDNAAFYDDKTNRLRPAAELAASAARVPKGPAIAYCNTGHWAATDWFVLSELLGRTDTRIYDGSIIEWTSNPGRPVASARTKWDDIKKTLGLGL
jgi:thiosulfate/3-mercaptopyruvate sulfurtransferase